jgi:hypothetical protein
MRKPDGLPKHLHAAFDWVNAGNEIDELRDMPEHDALDYAREAAEASYEYGDDDIESADVLELYDWLRARKARRAA